MNSLLKLRYTCFWSSNSIFWSKSTSKSSRHAGSLALLQIQGASLLRGLIFYFPATNLLKLLLIGSGHYALLKCTGGIQILRFRCTEISPLPLSAGALKTCPLRALKFSCSYPSGSDPLHVHKYMFFVSPCFLKAYTFLEELSSRAFQQYMRLVHLKTRSTDILDHL